MATSFLDRMRERVKGRGRRIVLPEGIEERALRAAALLRDASSVFVMVWPQRVLFYADCSRR